MCSETKEEPRVLFTFRVALPDRPGALAQLASLIAAHDIDVRAIDVLGGRMTEAVDQFLLDGDSERVEALAAELRRAGTFTLIGVRRAGITKESLPELALTQAVAKQPDSALGILTDASPRLFDADWAVGFESGFARARRRTALAPDVDWTGRVPMRSSRVSGQGLFTLAERPHATMVVAPIPEFGVVLVGRDDGMPFHDTEVLRVQQLMLTIDALMTATGLRIGTPATRSSAGGG
jgi:hypothetical protein